MRFFLKCVLVGLAVILNLTSAQAAERRQHNGMSFSIVVGGQIAHRYAHKRTHDQRVVSKKIGCSSAQVSSIARDYGIQFQTILRKRNTLTVVGYRNGQRAKIRFSRAPDCRIVS